jgi:AcrR family transcriptional regulator
MVNSEVTNQPKKLVQILSTAEDLFQRFGFKRITIEEICSKATVSKMTFYKYFPNKNELIKSILHNWLDQIVVLLEEIQLRNIPFTEKIKILLRLKEESNSKFSKEFIQEYMNPDPEIQLIFRGFYDRGISIFIDFIKASQVKGEVRKDIKPEFLYAVLNKIIELAKDQELVNLYPKITDFSLEINNFIYFGILPFDALEIEDGGGNPP